MQLKVTSDVLSATRSKIMRSAALGILSLVITSVCVGAEPPPAARDTPKGELHDAVARVIYPNRIDPNRLSDPSIQAELEPGPFTIPEGYVVTKLRYHFADPKTGFEYDKVTATTIYSVTEHRYVKEAKNNPDIVLPAGEYKVVCGGFPEATGVLTYTLIREDLVDRPKEPRVAVPGERILDVETWLATARSPGYNPKLKATYHIRGGKVTGTIDQLVEPPKYDNGVTCDPFPTKGTFSGEMVGNVITGTWDVKTGAHKMHFSAIPGADYPNHNRTDTSSRTSEIRLVLNPDGTLSQSEKGSGVSESVWGPTAPKSIANQRSSTRYDFEIPGKDIPEPLQGSWKDRK
jgi:hypothetical protein